MAEPLRNEKGHWLKGQSGNLKGAPVGLRELTRKLQEKLLEEVEIPWKDIKTLPAALSKLDRMAGDKVKISPADFLCSQLSSLILTRTIHFPDGEEWKVSPEVYTEMYKWMFAQIDGAPKQEIDANINGKLNVNFDLFARASQCERPVLSDTEADGSLPEASTP